MASVLAAWTVGPLAAADRIPSQLGFSGGFSHRPDDSFEFDFPLGHQLVVSRGGDLTTVSAGDTRLVKDAAGRTKAAVDGQGPLYQFGYNASGQLVAIRTRQGSVFHLSYARDKQLVFIHFPNHSVGNFPPAASAALRKRP
jgi:YD repeat-containing protein